MSLTGSNMRTLMFMECLSHKAGLRLASPSDCLGAQKSPLSSRTARWRPAELLGSCVVEADCDHGGPGVVSRLGLIGFVFPTSEKPFILIIPCFNRTYVRLSIQQIGFVLKKIEPICRGFSTIVEKVVWHAKT